MFHMWMHAVGGFPSATYFRATLFPLNNHCVKSVQIKSFSGPYFLVFRLNTQIYSAKYGPEKTPYWHNLYAISNATDKISREIKSNEERDVTTVLIKLYVRF